MKQVVSEYVEAVDRYLQINPRMGKAGLVELLTKRFPTLPLEEAWMLVSRYFNQETNACD